MSYPSVAGNGGLGVGSGNGVTGIGGSAGGNGVDGNGTGVEGSLAASGRA